MIGGKTKLSVSGNKILPDSMLGKSCFLYMTETTYPLILQLMLTNKALNMVFAFMIGASKM
jgi:hypothetical protein